MNRIPEKLSLKQIKYYSSLLTKKGRKKEQQFIVEGKRIVEEALNSSFEIQAIIITKDFFEKTGKFLSKWEIDNKKLFTIADKDFKKISVTKSPQGIAAVLSQKSVSSNINTNDNLIVALENISDPGNLGTILRNCDWFGIKRIILNENCADYLNPKTLRASMGSFFHVNIFEEKNFYSKLSELQEIGYNIIYTDLTGEDIFKFRKPEKTIIIFSNEAFGPTNELKQIANYSLSIPKIGKAESLNVASASAVILSELTKTLAK